MQELGSTLHHSKQFVLLHLVMLLGSLAMISYLSCAWKIKLLVIVGCVLYSVHILKRQRQWQYIRHDKSGWWLTSAGKECNIEISGDSTVTAYVTVLRFIIPEKKFKQTCVIFKDAMDADSYRKMVVRLRYFDSKKINEALSKDDGLFQ